MKYKIDTAYDASTKMHSFEVVPEPGAQIAGFRSDAIYKSSSDALVGGVRYLEVMGVQNINWHAVLNLFT